MEDITIDDINDDYMSGKYANFEIIIMKRNNYVNATKLCNTINIIEDNNKLFRKWKINSRTQELLDELQEHVNQNHSKNSESETESDDYDDNHKLMIIKKDIEFNLSGTYVHPDLIPDIASWCSPKFSLKVSRIINKYYNNKTIQEKDVVVKKLNKIIKQNDKLSDQNDKLSDQNDKLSDQNDKLSVKIDKQSKSIDNLKDQNTNLIDESKKHTRQLKKLKIQNNDLHTEISELKNKYTIASNDIVVKTKNENKVNKFIVVRNNQDTSDSESDSESETDKMNFDYYVMRIKKENFNASIKNHKKSFPDMEIIINLDNPNAGTLWNLITEKMQNRLEIKGNYFRLKGSYTENKMIKEIIRIHNKRLLKDR
jgi:predicted nuclease with TOPRIM domain